MSNERAARIANGFPVPAVPIPRGESDVPPYQPDMDLIAYREQAADREPTFRQMWRNILRSRS